MAAATIDLKTTAQVVGLIIAIETAGILLSRGTTVSPMLLLGGMRVCDIFVVSLLLSRHWNGAPPPGGRGSFFRTGMCRGALWSAGIAVLTVICFLVLSALGHDPLGMIRHPLPGTRMGIAGYFLVGGLLSPVAEELIFRGLLYGYFRRWGILPALIISTLLFVLAHMPGPFIPIAQLLGGVIFAVAYEMEKNLIVPIVIHISGNMAIFGLCLF